MNLSKRFKSLPISTQKLLGLGIVVALVVALPLFVWAIIYQNFNPNKKAFSGEPGNTIVCSAGLSDNFDATTIDYSQWTATSQISQAAGQLSITIQNDANESQNLISTKWIDGDFQADINVSQFTASPSGSDDLATAELKAYADENNYFTIRWVKWSGTNSQINLFSINAGQLTQGYGITVPSDAKPTLRLVRSGNIIRGYFNLGSGFQELPAIPATVYSGPVRPSIFAYKRGAAGSLAVFDNFGLGCITTTATIPPSLSPSPTPTPTLTPTSPPSPTPPPTACPTNPFTVEVSPSYQKGNPGQTLRYGVTVINNDPSCGPLHVTLSVDHPSNWTANFGTQNFQVGSFQSYSTYLDVTSPTSSYGLGPQPITVRVTTVNVGNSNSQTFTYDLVSQPLYQILKFLFKFSGVSDDSASGANVAIRFLKPNVIDYLIAPVKVSYVGNGVYSAIVGFSSNSAPAIPEGNDYIIYIKGEKHLARKFCFASGQNSLCPSPLGYIGIGVTDTPSEQVFDFTGLALQPGDVGVQDGAADINDFNKIKDLLTKPAGSLTAQDKLIGDLDYNGFINVKDLFLMRKTLEAKYDEN